MFQKLKSSFLVLSPIVLSLFFSTLARAEDIVLGMSAAFSGPSRALGIELYRGSIAYIDYINRNGGINGKTIAIQAYDDGYNPIPAIQNTIRLVEDDRVFALFNYVGTPTVTRILPLLPRYNKQQVYLFFPFTGAQPQRQFPYQQFVFNLRASYAEETAGLVDNFLKIGRKRIAVFYQADAYGRSGWEGVRQELAIADLKMVGEATYRRGTPYSQSLQEQVEILKAVNPDAIISIGAYAACAAFIRDARDAGLDVPIANISFVGSESLLNLLLETGRETGRDYTNNLINSQVVPSYEDTDLPAVLEYRELMAKSQIVLPEELRSEDYQTLEHSFVSFEGFLNAKLLVEILRRMNEKPERLAVGDRGARVVELQQRLHDRGFYAEKIDGAFGETTAIAVQAFQSSVGIEADGQVGEATWMALFDGEPVSLPSRSQIVSTVESIENLELGINAPVYFDANKHQGLSRVYYTTIEDRRFVPLRNWERWAK